ncbi:prenyltransferase [Colwelliaceae bacterium 6471]
MKAQGVNLTNNNSLWQGFWRLADPKITLASMSSIFLASCLVVADGELNVLWLLVTVFAFFAIEVAKNASGDIYDYQTDIAVATEDRTEFSGGKRVIVDGLLSRNQTWTIALIFYLLGIGAGVVIVFFREPQTLWIGLIGLLLAWCYNGPPGRFAYRGLGELDVAVCYGPLICLSTYLIQLGEFSTPALLISIPLGLLIAAFLWVNEFPDYQADVKANKRNMVVRLGRFRASRTLPILQVSAFIVLIMLPMAGFSYYILLGGIAVIPSFLAAINVWRDPQHAYRHFPVSAMALLAFLLMSLGCGIGVLI